VVLQRTRTPGDFVGYLRIASFRFAPPDFVVILLLRSGKSVEIVQALGKLRSAGTNVIAVTNVLDSPLAQQGDMCLPLCAKFDHLVSITMYSGLALAGGHPGVSSGAFSSEGWRNARCKTGIASLEPALFLPQSKWIKSTGMCQRARCTSANRVTVWNRDAGAHCRLSGGIFRLKRSGISGQSPIGSLTEMGSPRNRIGKH
jgi:hypothetical protein